MPQMGSDRAMSELSQDNKPGSLTTPLGKDFLVLVSFSAEEGLSELFEFRIEALSEKADIDFDPAIGKPCSVKIKTYKNEIREFNGILVEAQWLGVKGRLFRYRLILRPWLWLLSHTTDCRIFENKKAPDIIEEVFKDRGFNDFKSQIQDRGSFPELEYCVQYRETDFNFVSRLMEKEGIYYFFEHEKDNHTLVLANMKGSHHPVPNHDTILFNPHENYVANEQHIRHWVSGRRFRTGKIELNDYNYEKPNVQMLSQAKASERYKYSDMEVYDYPGNYKDQSVGERYAKIELEAEQAHDHRRQGSGDAISLFPGGLTKLKAHTALQNTEYLIVRAVHSFGDQSYFSSAGGEERVSYSGQYEFLPSDRPFRAPMVTPKPRIYGIQTAKVVTKDEGGSEEIDVEKLTEIYVWFYWDRKKHKEKRSCKIRVAQVWSGKKWGGQFIPRVGMEVVVEFIEGDPDRPLIVGTVYNDEYKPPYDLPSKKNIAGIYSDTTKGGGGYNEFHLDDTKMCEKIRMHAEKDHEVVIRHAETTEIGETFEIPLGSPSRKTTIHKGDDNLTLETGSQNIDIAGMQTTNVKLMISTTATVSLTLTVGMSTITMTPASISLNSPVISLTAMGTITLTAPNVTIGAVLTTPSLMAGAALVSGVPV